MKKHHLLVFVSVLVVVLFSFIDRPTNIISWDAFGYYLYLPMTFIYNDLAVNNIDVVLNIFEQYKSSNTLYQLFPASEGGHVMVYTMGMAIHYAPAFLFGHIAALLSGAPADGFSQPYQNALLIWGLFYAIIGLWFFYKILRHFFDPWISSVTLFLVVLGTNYLIHITLHGQNAYTHNYLFTDYAILIYLTIKWHQNHKWKYLVFLSIITGLMILSRPTEIIALLIPLLWNVSNIEDFKEKLRLLLHRKIQLLVFTTIILLIGSLQLFYWKMQTGTFLFNSYGINPGVGLDLFNPHTIDFLFSFRKGWFIYTPLAVFFIIGFFALFRLNRKIFLPFLLFYIFNIYLISSWACWWYAASFSQRPMVSSLPISGILLGYFLLWLKNQSKVIKPVFAVVLILILSLNIFQSLKYRNGAIDNERMTKKFYFNTFFKYSVADSDRKDLLIDRYFPNGEKLIYEDGYNHNILSELTFEDENGNNDSVFYSGTKSYCLKSQNPFSPKIEVPYKEITKEDHIWFRLSARVYCDTNSQFSFVCTFTHNNYNYKYFTINSENIDLKANEWNYISFDYLSPEVRNRKDLFTTYFWLRNDGKLCIDDYKVETFTPK